MKKVSDNPGGEKQPFKNINREETLEKTSAGTLQSLKPFVDWTHLQRALAGGGQGQRQVHEGFEGPRLAVAGHALHGGLELALEQSHNDGLVQQFVFAPGQVSRRLVVQVVDVFLLVSFPVVGLGTSGEKRTYWKKENGQMQHSQSSCFQ